ncbi:GAF domain-containing protein [Candidatus Reidiella endopervernicosa]|uniref:GAF domain-containing protein n=1 Tax=Candidatus Reidiella endopervernicosa TaxID=2738883 RepID=UPI003B969C10
MLRIDDVYDEKALQRIHPNLCFNTHFDNTSGYRTKSMMVTPIKKDGVMLGVMQVLNHIEEKTFTEVDLHNAVKLATIIGNRFKSGSRYFCGSMFWASKPKQAANT